MPQLFWCWAPPQTCPPKSPPWHVFHANSMSCHTWTWCHSHGKTSRVQTWHVIHGHAMVMARHAMFPSHVTMTWQAPHEAGHAPNSCSTVHFLKIGFKTPFGFEELATSLSLRWKCETVESTMALNIATCLGSSPFNSSFWTASLTSWSDKALGSDSSIKVFTNFFASFLKSRWSGDSSFFFGIPAGAGQWASVNVAWIWDTHGRHASPWW